MSRQRISFSCFGIWSKRGHWPREDHYWGDRANSRQMILNCHCVLVFLRTVAITPSRNERGSEIPSSDPSLILTITNQRAAQTACERIVLCLELRSHSQRQYPADIRSRVDTTTVLLRPTRRTCTTYCTSPLRRTHRISGCQNLTSRELTSSNYATLLL